MNEKEWFTQYAAWLRLSAKKRVQGLRRWIKSLDDQPLPF